MKIAEVIGQLETFSPDTLTLEEPVSSGAISRFEKKYNLILPSDYKVLLTRYNGIDLAGTTVFGIHEHSDLPSLETVYVFEHDEVDNPMPAYLIPFSPDG